MSGAQPFNIASLAVVAGVTLSGTGTIASAISGGGTVVANGGTLVLTGANTAIGLLEANAGAVLDYTAGGNLTAGIIGAGTLELGGATTLTTAV